MVHTEELSMARNSFGSFGGEKGEEMKREIPLSKANRLLNSGPVVLVSTHYKGKSNIMTVAWQMPVSQAPPLVAISVRESRYSHTLIEKSREFVLNIPTIELLSVVDYCGSVSGRELDKFKEMNLTPVPAKKVSAPLIGECVGHLECKLSSSHEAGDHTVFVGEVVSASAEETLFDEHWMVEKAKLIHHLGGDLYTVPEKRIGVE